MKVKFITVVLYCSIGMLFAQSADEFAISKTLHDYINGSSFNQPEQIKMAFAKDATLYLTKGDGTSVLFSPETYSDLFKKNKPGTFAARIGNILKIEVYNDIATAKVEIIMPEPKLYFIDLFLLKKENNSWKIISKTVTRSPLESKGRILFIMSNAKTYGNSSIETGVSFSEIIYAYDTFIKNNYHVDFMTPNGGAIHLGRYYNAKDSLQRQYYTNNQFMTRLTYTKSPDEINASSYNAVYYVGGGSAMYQVPENKQIQNISMAIYEQNGIVSAVCHGTAGIVNLKTSDGDYLVENRKVNGYPDILEKKEKAYYKEFPFSIEEKIKQHGGDFKFSKTGWDSYYISDDRLITGQDPSSSTKVAEEVIARLEKQ
ncbi:nuclear transport factor 2 family protein [uncultured Psychroserpens sp.]|uniref:nuclear transport factor 2 family protein n=1 Tax=uncultured Psychroserpens sp. TaxID=255436 RepID=UPI002604B282|nr:nuclear transport factor 2 family protein [uncultured Psychroserpens sp.]